MNAFGKFDLAVAAVMVVGVVALIVKPSLGVDEGLPTTAPSPSAEAARSTAPSVAPFTATGQGRHEIDAGPYVMAWPDTGIGSQVETTSGLGIRLTMPAGWWSHDSGTAVVDGPEEPGGNSPTLAVHSVSGVVSDACPGGLARTHFEDVGPAVEDLTTALANIAVLGRSAPTDVMLGGYPATKIALSLSPEFLARCGGPEGRWIWENADGTHFGLLQGGTATVYIVDVDGERLVVTTHQRGASAEKLAGLDAIVASIDITKGVSFSFGPTPVGWERYGDISLNMSIRGPQGAEAMVYWTSFPDGLYADPCGALEGLAADASIADLASAVARAPGIEVSSGPSDVTVDGRAAKHVVVVVRDDVGCDPGYFFSWRARDFGMMWMETLRGDTIRMWIVDVDGTILFIAGMAHKEALPGVDLTETERTELDLWFKGIVDSIRFE